MPTAAFDVGFQGQSGHEPGHRRLSDPDVSNERFGEQQRRALAGILKLGRGCLSGNRGQKGDPVRRRSRAVVCVASRGRGDPDGHEGTSCVTGHFV
jgi:hypothetical protein